MQLDTVSEIGAHDWDAEDGWRPLPRYDELIRLSHPLDTLYIARLDAEWYEYEYEDGDGHPLGVPLLDADGALDVAEAVLRARIDGTPPNPHRIAEKLPEWQAHFFEGRGGYRAEFGPADLTDTRKRLGLSARKLGELLADALTRNNRPTRPGTVYQRIRRFEAGEVKSLTAVDLDALLEGVIPEAIAVQLKAEPITVEVLA